MKPRSPYKKNACRITQAVIKMLDEVIGIKTLNMFDLSKNSELIDRITKEVILYWFEQYNKLKKPTPEETAPLKNKKNEELPF